MMEWSYLYLVVPPAVALGAAVVAVRFTRRSAARVDRMQAQYDHEERGRATLRDQIAGMKADIEATVGKQTSYGSSAYAGGSEVVHIGPGGATRHG